MPDSTPVTPESPAVPAPEPSAQQSSINQELARAISRAENIARVAQNSTHLPRLLQHGLTTEFIVAILTGADAARSAQTSALMADADQAGEVDSSELQRRRLNTAMQQCQAWARSVHFFSNPARLAVYHIGEDLDANLSVLQQFSLDIRSAALADALPGCTPAFLASYQATRAALFGPETPAAADDPGAAPAPDDAAISLRQSLDTKVQALTRAAMRILFLADGIWPYSHPDSAGPRHAFGLPPDRPYAPPSPSAPVSSASDAPFA
jgi:hypothetical protein